MKKSLGEGSELDGYDQLKPEDQARVIKAWQDGHVADEDIPDSARKAADEDGEEKPKKAKRAPAKKKAPSPTVRKRRGLRGRLLPRFALLLSNSCTLFH